MDHGTVERRKRSKDKTTVIRASRSSAKSTTRSSQSKHASQQVIKSESAIQPAIRSPSQSQSASQLKPKSKQSQKPLRQDAAQTWSQSGHLDQVQRHAAQPRSSKNHRHLEATKQGDHEPVSPSSAISICNQGRAKMLTGHGLLLGLRCASSLAHLRRLANASLQPLTGQTDLNLGCASCDIEQAIGSWQDKTRRDKNDKARARRAEDHWRG